MEKTVNQSSYGKNFPTAVIMKWFAYLMVLIVTLGMFVVHAEETTTTSAPTTAAPAAADTATAAPATGVKRKKIKIKNLKFKVIRKVRRKKASG